MAGERQGVKTEARTMPCLASPAPPIASSRRDRIFHQLGWRFASNDSYRKVCQSGGVLCPYGSVYRFYFTAFRRNLL
jgi:hypothetical protein